MDYLSCHLSLAIQATHIATGTQLVNHVVACGSLNRVTAAKPLTAVEIILHCAWELSRTAGCLASQACTGDLEVKSVIAFNIFTNVGDLHNHPFAHKAQARATPGDVFGHCNVLFIGEDKLKALTTIGVTSKVERIAPHCDGCETHADAIVYKWLLRCAAGSYATITNRNLATVVELLTCHGVASLHRLRLVAFVWPGTAGFAAIPIACGPGSVVPPMEWRQCGTRQLSAAPVLAIFQWVLLTNAWDT